MNQILVLDNPPRVDMPLDEKKKSLYSFKLSLLMFLLRNQIFSFLKEIFNSMLKFKSLFLDKKKKK